MVCLLWFMVGLLRVDGWFTMCVWLVYNVCVFPDGLL